MKNKYLDDLREFLKIKYVSNLEIESIIDEYSILYDEAIESGLTDEEIISKLGSPIDIYESLKEDLNKEIKFESKATGLMVFVSIILFFVVGQAFKLWNYSWLFFFLIPLTAVLSGKKSRSKLPAVLVFVVTPLFYVLGRAYNLWHPAWLLFLLIPLAGVLNIKNEKEKLVGMMPFITVIVYFIISYVYNDFYLYGWPIFLLIPLVGCIYIENKIGQIIMASTLLLSTVIYYLLAFLFGLWSWPLLIFIVPIAYAIYAKYINIDFPLFNNMYLATGLFSILITYLVVSLLTTGWAWSWMILLLVPMLTVYGKHKFTNIIEYMPFISLILFYSFGYFIEGGWVYSWLFFLLIPMVSIVFPKKEK